MARATKRTPIGVYHVTSAIPGDKLADLYGSARFRSTTRTNGTSVKSGPARIWLSWHAEMTPHSRAHPWRRTVASYYWQTRISNALSTFVTPGETPVIISDQIEWPSLDSWQAETHVPQQGDRIVASRLGKPR